MQRDEPTKPRWDPAIFVVGLMLFLSILACEGSKRVPPTDPRIPPPIAEVGETLDDYLRFIGLFPLTEIPPPWIMKPINNFQTDTSEIEVAGFAVSAQDLEHRLLPERPSGPPEVVLYRVPSADYPFGFTEELGRIEVEDSRQWLFDKVPVTEGGTSLAALTVVGSLTSGWSNVVSVLQTQGLPEVRIESPAQGDSFTIDIETVEMTGAGPENSTLMVWRRVSHPNTRAPKDEELEEKSTTIGADGRWRIAEVPLSVGETVYYVRVIAGQGQGSRSNEVQVRRDGLQWPLDHTRYRTVTQWFWQCCNRQKFRHYGIDIDIDDTGTEVLAAAPGTVDHVCIRCVPKEKKVSECVDSEEDCKASKDEDGTEQPVYTGCGRYVQITHSGRWQGYRTVYAHLASFSVTVGSEVNAGDPVGIGDNTGDSSGSHLHFEVYRQDANGVWQVVNINPGREIKGKFSPTDRAWYGEALFNIDWDNLSVGGCANTWPADCKKLGYGCE